MTNIEKRPRFIGTLNHPDEVTAAEPMTAAETIRKYPNLAAVARELVRLGVTKEQAVQIITAAARRTKPAESATGREARTIGAHSTGETK